MKIVVCVKQVTSGELNPFDACALECALRIPNSEITLLSMGTKRREDCPRGQEISKTGDGSTETDDASVS